MKQQSMINKAKGAVKWFLPLYLFTLLPLTSVAQTTPYQPGLTTEGAIYYLPKTAFRFVIQTEQTRYIPGEYAAYAERYLALHDVKTEPETTYRLTHIDMAPIGVADTAKCFVVKVNPKTTAANIELAKDGVLLAVNSTVKENELPPAFKPARKPAEVNPRQFLNEEILSAGSTAKRAELIAQEIFNTRESKNQLIRGEADYMPKDGEQLRIMLAQLDKQNEALSQLFVGTTVCDTTEYVLTVCPMEEIKSEVLFRLSRKLGLVDVDDLSGEPFYLTVEDLKTVPAPVEDVKKKKKVSEEGIYVNVPGRIKVSVHHGNETLYTQELPAGQFGNVELLGEDLFNKRYITHIGLNPVNGGIDKLESEQVK